MTAAAFRATYSDWRLIKGRKVVQVVFELPLEQADQAYDALGGMPNPAAEVWCGIARLVQPAERTVIAETNDSTLPVSQPASVPLTSPPRRASDKKLSQLAGMLSKTPLFHVYLAQRCNPPAASVTEEEAATYIRTKCGVASRAAILPMTDAANKFIKLYDDFIRWRDADQYVEAS